MIEIILCLAFGTSSPLFLAQADQPQVDALITSLDAPTLDERERATMGLVNLFELTLEQVGEALDGDGLSPEQRRRLGGVGAELFGRAPKGGLGVQFGLNHSRGVQIERTVDNGFFPAAALLEPGDVITHADGRELGGTRNDDTRLFRVLIISRLPGETIALTVERGDETLQIDAPLGSFENLGNAAMIDPATATAAFRERRSRMGKHPTSGQIASGLTPEDWIAAAFDPAGGSVIDPDDDLMKNLKSAPIHRPAQFVGGRPARERRHSGWAGRPFKDYATPRLAGRSVPTNLTPEMRATRYAELMNERTALVRENKGERRALENTPGMAPGQQALARARILDREDRMAELEKEMAALAMPGSRP